VLESILRFRFRAVLGEQEGFKVLVGFVRGLEEKSWGTLAAIVQSIARPRYRHLLGRFSSSMVTSHVL
jgi:membrane-associated phospholipid phosphatase